MPNHGIPPRGQEHDTILPRPPAHSNCFGSRAARRTDAWSTTSPERAEAGRRPMPSTRRSVPWKRSASHSPEHLRGTRLGRVLWVDPDPNLRTLREVASHSLRRSGVPLLTPSNDSADAGTRSRCHLVDIDSPMSEPRGVVTARWQCRRMASALSRFPTHDRHLHHCQWLGRRDLYGTGADPGAFDRRVC
jgi:hypothetical protein